MNLEKPRTYNDKPQRIKPRDWKLHIPKWFDTHAVREYVESKGLGSFPRRLIWQGFDLADISFDDFPEGFVIKVTHSSTFNIICTDKSKLEREGVLYKCRSWIKAKFLPCCGEWFHGIERFLVVEEYLEEDDGPKLRDYKVFCFSGTLRLISVDSDRGEVCHQDICDIGWNLLSALWGATLEAKKSSLSLPAWKVYFRRFRGFPWTLRMPESISLSSKDGLFRRDCIHFGRAGFSRFGIFGLDEQMGDWLKLQERGM